MKLKVVNISGKETGTEVTLSKDIFGIEPNEHAVYLAVKQYMAHQRSGTHKTKERGEVKGSTRKIKKQKGTGTARAGDIKNPLFRGGGRVFGPRPHKYSLKLNKKVSALARRSALSAKAAEGKITIVENFTLEQPKTKDFTNILSSLGVAEGKVLLLTDNKDENLVLSSRNVAGAKVGVASHANTYDLLNTNVLVLTEGALKAIEETFKK